MGVGGFPGIREARRKTIRAPLNPMDKATVVSIYPREINEIKPTVQPGVFHISPGTFDKPVTLIVGSSSWWREIDADQPLVEITNSSIQVADSIIRDYCSLIGCNMSDSMPGLFWVPGSIVVTDLKKESSLINLMESARSKQNKMFTALVRLADGLWARTNGNPLVISEDMRMAARELNLTAKDWMKDFTMMQKTPCPSCGSPYNPEYPVCPTCKAIVDPAKAKALNIKFSE